MAKKDAIKKLDEHLDNRFLDWGLRDYFYRVFWNDYPLKRDIELAGYMSDAIQLEKNISTMTKPVASDNSSKQYKNLVKELTRYADKPSSSSLQAWNKIEKDVLAYFESDLRMYEDLGDEKNDETEGYFLNTQTGLLRYFDGHSYQEVSRFDSSGLSAIRKLFPSLFKSSSTLDILGQKNTQLKPHKFIQLIEVTKSQNPSARFHIETDTAFLSLFRELKDHALLRTKRNKHDDHRSAEELIADVVERMRERIEAYLNDTNKYTNPDKRAIMESLKIYLDTGEDDELVGAVRQYDSSWLNWLASWLYANEADKTYRAIMGMRSSPFFEKALKGLIAKDNSVLSVTADLSENSSIASVEKPDFKTDYEYDSRILDFEYSESKVNKIWQDHRVTKAAIIESLDKMLVDIRKSKTANDIDLPQISLPKELILDNDSEDKTVIEHIEDCIVRLQEKVAHDKTNGFFQTDCAFLQNSINRILSHRYQGNDTRKFLTEDQRALYVEIGNTLTNDLNQTQKQPVKNAEVFNSVRSVRAEIHRLIKFHNSMREKLTDFQQRLGGIDQGTFANDIEDFLTNGKLDERQKELDGLLRDLKDCQDDSFNVLNPQNANQKTVCDAVKTLNGYGTTLVDELSDILLMKQGNSSSAQNRSYIPIDQRKDREYAQNFSDIMKEVTSFSDTLSNEETSQLGTFFEVRNQPKPQLQPHSVGQKGMFGRHVQARSNTPPLVDDHDVDLNTTKKR